jgi:ABC-type transporter Mla subunit MlaD
MANIVPFAFKGELMSGTHNFSAGGNTFFLALYTSNPYSTASTVYDTTNEVSGSGGSNYTAGGKQLQNQQVGASTATTTVDFDNLTWGAATTGAATFGAAFAAIYNSTNANKIVVVLDFGGTKTATNGDFTIAFPSISTPANAILSLTSS